MGFFSENWLWRGTQSAIFYYVSCSPCIEFKYKRRRKREATRAEKQRAEIVTTQPGQIRQPGAFQTNEDWVEEILMGPGPPKGWKRDPIAQKLNWQGLGKSPVPPRQDREPQTEVRAQAENLAVSRATTSTSSATAKTGALAQAGHEATSDSVAAPSLQLERTTTRGSEASAASSSSSDSGVRARPPGPSIERRLSTAVDNLKDTLRFTIRPERWNWSRYERDDEVLSGFNQKVTRMWDKATLFGMGNASDAESSTHEHTAPIRRRKRASTNDSDRFDYEKYVRNPEINDLHPPVVSRLPATKDDAAWMLLPPPSAAVMGGTVRPQDEPDMRWPLAKIGRTPDEWKDLIRLPEASRSGPNSRMSSTSESIPDLSDSFTESSASDDESWKRSRERKTTITPPRWGPMDEQNLDLIFLKQKRRAHRAQVHDAETAS